MGITNICCGLTRFIICLCYWFTYSDTVALCPDSGTGSGLEVAESEHPHTNEPETHGLQTMLVKFLIYHLMVVLRSLTNSSCVVNLA